jgi:hypothetical protein
VRVSLTEAIKERAAVVAVGPSTARGQGAPGVVDALRDALKEVPLSRFSKSGQGGFRRALDASTQSVMQTLPRPARSWGLARKCLNIFLRDCFYNAYLRDAYGLVAAEPWFEIPLDRVVAEGLKENVGMALPRWPGVKRVSPELSTDYQEAALVLSRCWGITRVHLDTYLWIAGR